MREAADALSRREPDIVRRSVDLVLERMPDYAAHLTEYGRMRCQEDARFHLSFLRAALVADEHAMFVDYARWARDLLARYRVPASVLAAMLTALGDAVDELAPEAGPAARPVVDAGVAALAG